MNVLSLFDGMSCGQQALERAGIKVDNYFASEIDKFAIIVTMANYPNTVQLGSVVDIDCSQLPPIDLLIGGSPCQSFSFAGKRKGMSTKDETEILTLEHYLELKEQGFEFEGQSYLFWEYMRILKTVKPRYFLLENVEMGEKWERVLNKAIGVKGIHINSSLFCAQNRKRIYWTNIGMMPSGLFGHLESSIKQPKDKGILLKDILEKEVDEKYFLSQKMLEGLLKTTQKAIENNNGFIFDPMEGHNKSKKITSASGSRVTDNYIVHNTMPRSSTSKKGGSGPLSRNDGKTYCLDTGHTNAIELLNERQKANHIIQGIMLGRSKSWGAPQKDDNKSYTLCKEEPHGVIINQRIRRLTPIECERLQTVKDNYTNHVSNSQRYRMLGNGWTVDVIAYIFSYLPCSDRTK